jgi:excisionase family DNA binding protein
MDLSPCLKVEEVVRILNVGKSTVYEMYHAGKLSGPRIGESDGGIRILRSSVEALLNPPAAPAPDQPPAKPQVQPPRRRRTVTKQRTFQYLTPPPMSAPPGCP